MKCIIYGLGTGRLRIERCLKSEHEIIGYSDSFYGESEFNNKKFYKPSKLVNVDNTIIILSIGKLSIADKIETKLIDLV